MQHVSSSMTLLLKYAFPIAWLVFFGAMTIAFWLINDINVVAGLSISTFRIIITSFYFLGAILLYWSVMRLKRVEMDDHFFYVTNYLKNVRYPYHQISKINEKDYLLFKSVHINLKQPGIFGKKITFLASRNRFDNFLEEHPEVVKELENVKS